MTYSITVSPSGDFDNSLTNTFTSNNLMYSTGTNTSCTIANCYCNGYHYWTYPVINTVYVDRYQLRCPRCGEDKNWGELDKEIICKGKLMTGKACKATLKAVTKRTEFEIEV